MHLETEHEKQRLATQALLLETLKDLIAEDPESAAAAFVNAAAAVLVGAYPADLDENMKEEIRMNNPHVSDTEINRRAMSEDGVIGALMLSTVASLGALDVHPGSYYYGESLAPEEDEKAVLDLIGSIGNAFDGARKSGLSPQRTALMTLNASISLFENQGVPQLVILRALMEATEKVLTGGFLTDSESISEAAQQIAEQAGIPVEELARIFGIQTESGEPKLH